MNKKKVLLVLTNDCGRETLAKIINQEKGFSASYRENELNLEEIGGNDVIIFDPFPFFMTDQFEDAMSKLINSGAGLIVLDSAHYKKRIGPFMEKIKCYLEMPESSEKIIKALKAA